MSILKCSRTRAAFLPLTTRPSAASCASRFPRAAGQPTNPSPTRCGHRRACAPAGTAGKEHPVIDERDEFGGVEKCAEAAGLMLQLVDQILKEDIYRRANKLPI